VFKSEENFEKEEINVVCYSAMRLFKLEDYLSVAVGRRLDALPSPSRLAAAEKAAIAKAAAWVCVKVFGGAPSGGGDRMK
jgi:hypothetical protein